MTAAVGLAERQERSAFFSDKFRRALLIVFLFALLIPIQPQAGGQRLDPYRVLLLALCVPFFFALFKGKAGRFTISDGFLLGYASWIIITLVYHHGMARFAYAAIWAVELFGGYMLGRLLIRNFADYRRFIRFFLTALLILLPFALSELLTGRMLITEILGQFFPATEKFNEVRNGMSRSQVVFPHSILYGLFCSIGAANVYYLYREHIGRMLPRLGLVVGMTFMALSSAPLLSIGVQMIMAIWDKVTNARWMVLFVTTTTLYVTIEMLSNRGPIIILIESLTFDPSTAWWRVYIWEYGIQNVYAHPFMGLGLNDWARPYWLDSTVDNFWLLAAMRHGFPGVTCLLLALAFHIYAILRVSGLSPDQNAVRTGYMVTLVGLLFTLCTVHVWDSMAVFVMFYFGAGSFLYTGASEPDASQAETEGVTTRKTRAASYQRARAVPEADSGLSQGTNRPRVAYTRQGQTERTGNGLRHSRQKTGK